MSREFQGLLKTNATLVEDHLRVVTANQGEIIRDPLRHAVLNGGKRLRAFLALQSCALFDIPQGDAILAASAIECMHAYSLVHDDLPSMDDDDMRRGKPTVHVKWDEATAVLVGDALQTLCFELLSEVNNPNALRLINTMAKAAGANGMVLGQAMDIAAETAKHPLTLDQIKQLQSNKTGALIEWSATAGAILAGQDETALKAYSQAIGLAFQIQDDILDIEGDSKLAGKALQKDADAGKATFVSLLGIGQAKLEAKSLVKCAENALLPYGKRAEPMRQVAQFIIDREM